MSHPPSSLVGVESPGEGRTGLGPGFRTGFAVLDVETTGLSPEEERIIEVGRGHPRSPTGSSSVPSPRWSTPTVTPVLPTSTGSRGRCSRGRRRSPRSSRSWPTSCPAGWWLDTTSTASTSPSSGPSAGGPAARPSSRATSRPWTPGRWPSGTSDLSGRGPSGRLLRPLLRTAVGRPPQRPGRCPYHRRPAGLHAGRGRRRHAPAGRRARPGPGIGVAGSLRCATKGPAPERPARHGAATLPVATALGSAAQSAGPPLTDGTASIEGMPGISPDPTPALSLAPPSISSSCTLLGGPGHEGRAGQHHDADDQHRQGPHRQGDPQGPGPEALGEERDAEQDADQRVDGHQGGPGRGDRPGMEGVLEEEHGARAR